MLWRRGKTSACWELKHVIWFSSPLPGYNTDCTTLSPYSKHKLEKMLLQDREKRCILQDNVKFVLFMKDHNGGKIFHTRPDWPRAPPSLLSNGYWVSFPEVKQLGHAVDSPPPSSVEVKERVEIYLYSPSIPSWPVLGRAQYNGT